MAVPSGKSHRYRHAPFPRHSRAVTVPPPPPSNGRRETIECEAFDGFEPAPREESGDSRKAVSRAVAVPQGDEKHANMPSSLSRAGTTRGKGWLNRRGDPSSGSAKWQKSSLSSRGDPSSGSAKWYRKSRYRAAPAQSSEERISYLARRFIFANLGKRSPVDGLSAMACRPRQR